MIMSWLKYDFFAFITHHQPAAVNMVHLIIIITALVCFLYYQLQYCLYGILDFFFLSSDLANVGKWKLFVKKKFFFFLVWPIQIGSYSKWSCLADPLNIWRTKEVHMNVSVIFPSRTVTVYICFEKYDQEAA